jgi:hypothetical protein
VTFDIATADGTAQDDDPATEDNDYVAQSLTGQTIPAGSSTYASMSTGQRRHAVRGPTKPSSSMSPTSPNATVTDGQGQGTIVNDDIAPNLTIDDVTKDGGRRPSSSSERRRRRLRHRHGRRHGQPTLR